MKVVFAMVICLAAGTMTFAQSWDELNEKVMQLAAREAYAEAIPIAQKALQLAKEKYGPSDEYAASLNNLSTLYKNTGSLKEAERLMLECIGIMKSRSATSPEDYLLGLDNLALIYFQEYEYSKAETVLLEMAALTEKEKDSYLDILDKLADLYQQSGEVKKEEQTYLKKAAAYLSITGVKDSTYGNIITPLANLYVLRKKFTLADSTFKEIKTIIDAYYGRNSPAYASWLGNTGLLYTQMGRYAEAEEMLKQALEMKASFFGKVNQPYISSLVNLGLLYSDMAEYEKSMEAYNESRGLVKELFGDSSSEYVLQLMNEGSLYKDMEQFERAEALFTEAKMISASLHQPNSVGRIQVLHQLGELYIDMGKYAEAEQYLLEETHIVIDVFGKDDSYYSYCLNALANLYSEMGQAVKAQEYFVEASNITRETLGENSMEYASSLNNLAAVADDVEMEKWAYLKSIEIVEKLAGIYTRDYLNKAGNLGIAYLNNKEYDNAEKFLLEARKISLALNGDSSIDFAYRCMQLGECYKDQQLYSKAEKLLIQATDIAGKKFNKTDIGYEKYISNLADLYINMKNYPKAVFYLKDANAILFRSLISNLYILSEKEKMNYIDDNQYNFSLMNSILFNLRTIQDPVNKTNYDHLLMLKSLALSDSRSTLDMARSSDDSVVKKFYNEWLKEKITLAKQYALPQNEQSTELTQLEHNVELLEKELGRRSAPFRSLQKNIHLTTTDIQTKMDADEAAIEFVRFYIYDDGFRDSAIYAAYLLTKNNPIPCFIPLCSEKQLITLLGNTGKESKAIDALYRGVVKLNGQTARGKELYKLLWQPLEPYLQGINKIGYSPAGTLYNIAFHALPVDSNRVLMERYQLRQYTSTKEIALREKAGIFNVSNAVLFGDPDFSLKKLPATEHSAPVSANASFRYVLKKTRGEETGLWQALPGTGNEVDNIGKLLKKQSVHAVVYKNADASEKNAKRLSGTRAEVVHFATHGFFLPGEYNSTSGKNDQKRTSFELSADPLWRSGLVLSGANGIWSGSSENNGAEDGVLTAYEIAQLNLSNTELVVLSACETGLGEITETEGVFGLQRAFKMAGVKKMLISLWPVPDKETAEMMSLFYSNLRVQKNISKAFDNARLAMKQKYPVSHWAAFVLVE